MYVGTDDRFIMKGIENVEISSFEQIAPLYFEHITSALDNKVQSAADIIATVGQRICVMSLVHHQ